jgi:electron transport complex protein RnfG
MLEGIFPEASFYNLEDDIYIIYDDSKYEIGYAFYAKGMGWGGNIVILVGLEDKETIKGINIISHSELLCVGEFGIPLDFSTFTKQFIGLKIDDCALKKNDGQVDAITGAITSSKAVVDIVRETELEKVKFIR